MDALLRPYSAAMREFFLAGADWANRWSDYYREIVYAMLALSVALFVLRLRREKREGGLSGSALYTVNWILLLAVSALEIFYVLAMGQKATWFCKPGQVGWLWTLVNFLVFGYAVYNQLLCYFNTLGDAGRNSHADCGLKWGVYSWPAAVIAAVACGVFYEPGLPIVGGLFLVVQLVQIGVLFRGIVPRGGWGHAVLCAAIYLLGAAATVAMLMHFLALLIVVLVGFLILAVFAGGGAPGANSKKPVPEKCPICGSTWGCTCKARQFQKDQESFEKNRW